MGGTMLDDWLNDQGIYNEDNLTVVPLRGHASSFNIVDPAIRKRWAELLTGHDYLIVDPLKPVLDAIGLDERSEAGKFLTPFDELLADAGIPDALITHHMGHYGERSRGDSTLRGWPDVEWFIVREQDDPGSPRYIKAFGRDVDQPEALLNYDHDTRHLTLTGGSRQDAKAREMVPVLIAAVKDHYGRTGEAITTNQLNDQLDGSKNDVVRASHLAENQGLVNVTIGARNSRLHYPVVTTGTEPVNQQPVQDGPIPVDPPKTAELLEESQPDARPVLTGIGQSGTSERRPVSPVHIGEPVVDQSELRTNHPPDDRTTEQGHAFASCPECGLSSGRHGSVCRHREPTPEEIAT